MRRGGKVWAPRLMTAGSARGKGRCRRRWKQAAAGTRGQKEAGQVHTHSHIHTYTHTHIHTYTHMHTHTHTQISLSFEVKRITVCVQHVFSIRSVLTRCVLPAWSLCVLSLCILPVHSLCAFSQSRCRLARSLAFSFSLFLPILIWK